MRILHVCTHFWFKFGERPHMQDRKISNGLVRLGHYVYDFSYRDVASYHSLFRKKKRGKDKMNRSLLETIEKLEPQLLLLGHSELVTEQTLAFIRDKYPNMLIAMWYVDALYKAPQFVHKLKHLDAFFATGGGPELESLREHTDARVCFFPNVCDPSLDSFSAYQNSDNENDLIFMGTAVGGARDQFLFDLKKELSDIRFGIYGFSKETKRVSVDYLKTIASSSMGLNYSRHNDQFLYTSDRQIHMAANGVLVFSPEIPGFQELFSDKEQVYFSEFSDLVEKVRFFQKNADERREIAQAGQLRAHESYNSSRVCKFMIEVVGEAGFSENYEWAHHCE